MCSILIILLNVCHNCLYYCDGIVAVVVVVVVVAHSTMNLLFYAICVAVAIICATATAAKQKHRKKQNVVPPHCTPEQFMGDYKYFTCQGVEMKVAITCDEDKETNPCDYTEAPMTNDNGNEDGCVVQGAFDATHIRMDPANPGVCQLHFVALKDSCKADTVPTGFGVKAEVDRTAGHAGTSISTSTLLLWFSNDGGVVYYNEDKPRPTVFSHQDFPKDRKLWFGCGNGKCDPQDPNKCKEFDCATESNVNWSDGCAACKCYDHRNDSWCDGRWSIYYDSYWKRNGKNPWGDPKWENRKCNKNFPIAGNPCGKDWKCGCEVAKEGCAGTCLDYGETFKETWVNCPDSFFAF